MKVVLRNKQVRDVSSVPANYLRLHVFLGANARTKTVGPTKLRDHSSQRHRRHRLAHELFPFRQPTDTATFLELPQILRFIGFVCGENTKMKPPCGHRHRVAGWRFFLRAISNATCGYNDQQ